MEFSKAIVDCMQTVRRRLRDESAVNIRLSQPDAIPAMLLACSESESEETRALGRQLSELSGVRPKPVEEPVIPARPLTEEELIAKYTRYAGPLRG
jgi:hypothetical protein